MKIKLKIINIKYMKNTFLIIILLVYCKLFGQTMDPKLLKYSNIIYNSICFEIPYLKNIEVDSCMLYIDSYEFNIDKKIKNITYYKIGVTSDHSYIYIALINEDNFKIFNCRDFSTEFIQIIDPLNPYYANIDNEKYFKFVKDVIRIFEYNNNPPWKKNHTFIIEDIEILDFSE